MNTADFHDPAAAAAMKTRIAEHAAKAGNLLKFMEVCGTHTMAIARFGLRAFLPGTVTLVSGPGCPVCVTGDAYIGAAVKLSLEAGVTIVSFGDMLRVPGYGKSLEQARAEGADVRIVYSPLDALSLASADPGRQVVFLGIGFETTAPLVASTILKAAASKMANFSVLCGHKTVPIAMTALVGDGALALDGFICPGHVSVVIGARAYDSVAAAGSPCVVTGFEPLDILQGVMMLTRQALEKRSDVEIQYTRAVKPEGNTRAVETLYRVFEPCDSRWRGIGVIPGSGLEIRDEFARFDAEKRFEISTEGPDAKTGCRCGDVLKGLMAPPQCPLFGRSCNPDSPVGPCMVSSEGSCAAAYRYDRSTIDSN